MKVGVFDSGLGGLSVARALEEALPEHEIIFRHDTAKHFPYGSKKPEELIRFVEPILHSLVRQGCAVIVIACNTVTSTIVEELRKRVAIHLVAIEPMVRSAAELTKSGVIAVCATPSTLKSPRYKWLKDTYASGVKVLEPNCAGWAKMIEQRKVERAMIADEINDVITLGADVIVLGISVYAWERNLVEDIAKGKAKVLSQDEDVIKAVKSQLKALQSA